MVTGDCCPPCPTVTVNVPGAPGTNGAAGAAGAAGINAFTITTGNFTIPALNANVTVSVANSSWAGIGQNVFVSDGTHLANFSVTSVPDGQTLQLKYLQYPGDSATAAVINSGATVSPSGLIGTSPATPISIANGGTNAATKGAAQTNLGLGQNPLIATSAGLSQAITASFVEVGTCDVQVVSTGTYLLLGTAIISMNGVTFASSRNITLKIRNITQGVDIASSVFPTEVLTTTNIPSFSLAVAFVSDATAVANDHYQLMITIDVINSAGTLNTTSGSLCAVPLRLT